MNIGVGCKAPWHLRELELELVTSDITPHVVNYLTHVDKHLRSSSLPYTID